FKGIVRTNMPSYFLVAHSEAGSGERRVEVFAYSAFDDQTIPTLAPRLGRILLLQIPDEGELADATPALDSATVRGMPAPVFGGLGGFPLSVRSLDSGKVGKRAVSVVAIPSLVVDRIVSTLGSWKSEAIW